MHHVGNEEATLKKWKARNKGLNADVPNAKEWIFVVQGIQTKNLAPKMKFC